MSLPFQKQPGESKQDWLACQVYCLMNPKERQVYMAILGVFETDQVESKLSEKIDEKFDWEARAKLYDQANKARVESELFDDEMQMLRENHRTTVKIGNKISKDYQRFCNNNPERVTDEDYGIAARTRYLLTQANNTETDTTFKQAGMMALLERFKDEVGE
ncbi:hypothetical protein [Crocosphaera sp.]|uniref:hypothetical protein n=1 Tax=Crocosphaera sp. TaxID=2729996 RepID=UPI0026369B86|nr:hypothetical protein [Crocosphaera sp.]MDJ0579055.1 hypothetical protein [Crocosphaera sp.]